MGWSGTPRSYDHHLIMILRYDPPCLGRSPGDWATVQFSDWLGAAARVLEEVCEGPTVLLGSSMGGWLALWLASQERYRPRVASLLLVAPAVNFLRPHYSQLEASLAPEVVRRLHRGELVELEEHYGVKYLRKDFADNSAQYELDLGRPLAVRVPCRILHGVQDDSVPWRNSLELLEVLEGERVEVVIRKEAGHRFMEPDSLRLIVDSVEALAAR